MRQRRGQPEPHAFLLPLLLLVVCLVIYLNSFAGAFLFDDLYAIVNNPRIRHLWPLGSVLTVTTRPFVMLSFAVNYALGGFSAWGYHAVNVAIHLCASLVLFGIVRRTLTGSRLRERYGTAAPWLALSIALMWMAHPLQTESVTYIVQRAEALMGLCLLLTLYSVSRSASAPARSRWSTAAVAACALGMAAKPVMAVAPLIVLLYDRFFLAESWRRLWRERGRLYLGLAATWSILLVILSRPHESGTSAGFGIQEIPPLHYALTQPGVILHYMKLVFWPAALCLDYGWPVAGQLREVWRSMLVVALLGGMTIWAAHRSSAIGFLGVWWFLLLAPSSSVIPLKDVAAEHRMYLPLMAPVALIVIGSWHAINRLARSAAWRRGVAASLVMFSVAGLGWLTIRRNETYRSSLAMWQDVIAKRPANARARWILGGILAEQGRLNDAEAQFAEAVRLNPAAAQAHNNWGVALMRHGRVDDAIARFREAARLDPASDEALINLGNALAQQGRFDEAIVSFADAARLNPASHEAHVNLGNVLLEQGRFKEAIGHFADAARLNPYSAQAQNSWGIALVRLGRVDDALSHFTEAVRLDPRYRNAQDNLKRVRAAIEQHQ